MQKNVGKFDAVLRFLLGIFLVYLGLFILKGIQGNLLGILVALISIMPFYMAITRKCFVFKFFKISSIPRKKH
jgi:hypothetical protein